MHEWCDTLLGAGICLQSTGRPSCFPGRLAAEAEHGDSRPEPRKEGKPTGGR